MLKSRSGDESTRVRTASLYTALWENVDVAGLKMGMESIFFELESADSEQASGSP
jgi:hypothetical protein